MRAVRATVGASVSADRLRWIATAAETLWRERHPEVLPRVLERYDSVSVFMNGKELREVRSVEFRR